MCAPSIYPCTIMIMSATPLQTTLSAYLFYCIYQEHYSTRGQADRGLKSVDKTLDDPQYIDDCWNLVVVCVDSNKGP